MADIIEIIEAPTLDELKEKVFAFVRQKKAEGLTDIRSGWVPEKVVRKKDGYKIQVWIRSEFGMGLP
jgi:hypothetical protein